MPNFMLIFITNDYLEQLVWFYCCIGGFKQTQSGFLGENNSKNNFPSPNRDFYKK